VEHRDIKGKEEERADQGRERYSQENAMNVE
jgi:hypothetical protein